MSVLSENIKTIRKNHHFTQLAMAETMNIGFRTYIRYETGQRDASLAALIKIARAGAVSLDRLLTAPLSLTDLQIPDLDKPATAIAKPDVVGGSLEEGRLVFKGLKNDFLVCTDANEKKLLHQFRRLDRSGREKFVQDVEALGKIRRKEKTPSKPIPKKILKEKNVTLLKKLARGIQKTTIKG
jgi:transcriptional regulator with XRE-family HTH domain